MENQDKDLKRVFIGFIVLVILFAIAAHLEYLERLNYWDMKSEFLMRVEGSQITLLSDVAQAFIIQYRAEKKALWRK